MTIGADAFGGIESYLPDARIITDQTAQALKIIRSAYQ